MQKKISVFYTIHCNFEDNIWLLCKQDSIPPASVFQKKKKGFIKTPQYYI